MPVIMYTKANLCTLQVGQKIIQHKEERENKRTGEMEEVVVREETLKAFRFRFLPGPNNVPADKWDRLKEENDACQNMLSMDTLKPLMQRAAPKPAPAKGKPTRITEDAEDGEDNEETSVSASGTKELDSMDDADVSKLDGWGAVALVKGVIDKSKLLLFQKQENERLKSTGAKPRKSVVKAIEEQLKAVEGPPDGGGNQADLHANAERQKV